MPVGPTIKLKIDINGTAESRVLAFDFVNLIAAGDSLGGTPTIEQNSEDAGAALTFGSPSVSGTVPTQVVVRLGGTGLTARTFYDVSCTVSTASGDTLVSSCGVLIVPSK